VKCGSDLILLAIHRRPRIAERFLPFDEPRFYRATRNRGEMVRPGKRAPWRYRTF